MDIKEYVLGSPPPVGASFGVPTTSVGSRLAPLAPLTPNGRAEVGVMEIEGYVLGSPPPVGASFGVATASVGPRFAPSLLPSLPMD